ncbi:glutamate receptor ionotropic, delta-1-like [Panulirus ornatus]|uniref:glutamate receptor ionotropic, delta-1-like n=1 Tax=Panulirus ornatus TaxID=150431 RepID=UPI003A895DAA
MGRKLRIVTVPYFPYMDFRRDRDVPGTTVTPKDSIDTRLIYTFAKALNFTFEIREEPNRTWGLQEGGVFTGMMGQLQREEADFCTIAGPSPERLEVVEYLRGYPSDLMTVTTLKPSLLPEHLSLIRAFEGELWLLLLGSVAGWGTILWLLQKTWWWLRGGRNVKFSAALMYSWGALMEQPPTYPYANTSARMVVGWWLVFCLVIDTAYRSSLIAHMTVLGKSQPIETFEDVVKQDGWKWGTEPWLLKGVPYDYFSKHTDPVVKQLFKSMEVVEAKEALQKVLAGGYSLIDFENYVTIIVASGYTDSQGNNPFFISKKGISIMAAFGWGFRKGAPFYPRFKQLKSRLEDAGIISYWIDEVIAKRVRENRQKANVKLQAGLDIAREVGVGHASSVSLHYLADTGDDT